MTELKDVPPCTFADGNDMVCLAYSLTELPGVDLRINPVVVFGMTEEDKVVDGHHALDARLADAPWQLARETMIKLNSIALQVADDPTSSPQRFVERYHRGGRVAERHIGTLDDLIA